MKQNMLVPTLDYLGPKEIKYTSLTPSALENSVFTLFTAQVRQRPEKLAILDGNGSFTYQELWNQACFIAQNVNQSVSNENLPIGIWLENDRQFVAAMLAALALGRPYVGLDVSMPPERNRAILNQAGINTLISLSAYKSDIEAFDVYEFVYLDELTESDTLHFQPNGTPNSLAYIIYTSGTTGMPKGVFQNQRNLIHDVSQYIDSVHMSDSDRNSLLYSPTVGGAIRDIFGTLLTGATLYIRDLRQHGLASLAAFITMHQLTVYHSVPTIFRGFLQAAGQQKFPSVRLVYLAGDRIVNKDTLLYKHYFQPSSFLYIGIGSTENATIYRQWFVNHQTIITTDSVPVGYAVPDRTMHLQNADGLLTLPGEEGEIVVDSDYMALGYWRNTELTKSAFVNNGNGRRFHTGDLGYIRPDGLLIFIGRKDRQIKIAGHRIELADVEAVIRQAPSITDLAVIGRQNLSEHTLVVYLVENSKLDIIEVRHYCQERLPAYMMPAHWETIAQLPLLPNFKVDISALQSQDAQLVQKQNAQPKPLQKEDTETKDSWIRQVLKDTWCASGEGLKNSYYLNETWRNSGGSSLEAVFFMVKLEEQFGIEIPAEWIHGDMRPLWLEEQLLRQAENIQLPIPATHLRPVIYFFPALPGLGDALNLVRELQKNAEVHLIQYPELTKANVHNTRFEQYMKSVMKQISALPKPDLLIGCCSGSLPAHEIARQMSQTKNLIPVLIVIDFPAPLGFAVPFQAFTYFKLNHFFQIIMKKSLKKILVEIVRSLLPGITNLEWRGRHNYVHSNIYNIFTGLVRLRHLPLQIHLFRMNNHKDFATMCWEWLCDSISLKDFSFDHDGMFTKKENREEIIKELFEIIQQAKVIGNNGS